MVRKMKKFLAMLLGLPMTAAAAADLPLRACFLFDQRIWLTGEGSAAERISLDKESIYAGSRSVKIEHTGRNSTYRCLLSMPCKPGDLQVRFYIQGTAAGQGSLCVNFNSPGGKSGSVGNWKSKFSFDGEWSTVDLRAKVPQNTGSVELVFSFNGADNVIYINTLYVGFKAFDEAENAYKYSKTMDFYGKKMNVYRANLHTHSKTSDGLFTPQEVVDMYSAAGYDVLAFSDHWKTNDVKLLDNKGMTLISGMELHPMGPRGIMWHLLALNVPYGHPGEYESAQQAIDSVRAAGGIVFVAHPYWSGLTREEIAPLKNVSGIEVYNTSTRYIGKEYNMNVWDDLLDAGFDYPALAVDDMHTWQDRFFGWTMILAEDKSPQSIMKALANGDFYATQGPEIKSLSYENGIFRATFSPAARVMVMTNRGRGVGSCVEDVCGVLAKTAAEVEINIAKWRKPGDYFRLQICDDKGRYAWSNPIRVK